MLPHDVISENPENVLSIQKTSNLPCFPSNFLFSSIVSKKKIRYLKIANYCLDKTPKKRVESKHNINLLKSISQGISFAKKCENRKKKDGENKSPILRNSIWPLLLRAGKQARIKHSTEGKKMSKKTELESHEKSSHVRFE